LRAAVASITFTLAVICACSQTELASPHGGAPTNDAGGRDGAVGIVEGGSPEGGAPGTDSGSKPKYPLSTDCAAWAEAECVREQRCLPFLFVLSHAGVPGCVETKGITCTIAKKSPGVAVGLDFTACATATAARADCDLEDVPAECRLKGSLPDGALCEQDYQCLSGACSGPVESYEHPCRKCKQRVAEGASCDLAPCDFGLFCDFLATPDTCFKPPPLGAECTTIGCARPNLCVNGKCTAPLPTGAACTTDAGSSNPCGGLNRCTASPTGGASTCQLIPVAGLGEYCVLSCKDGLSCRDDTCVSSPSIGDACNPKDGLWCHSPAECIDGRCAWPAPDRCK
jgi:hypothetical protein